MPRAVGKRIPRLTVASKHQRDDNIRPANRRAKPDATNGDNEGAHLAVLALEAVCQRGGSTQVSRRPRKSSYQSSAYIKGSKDDESSEKPSVPAAVPLCEKNVNSRKKKKINRLSEIASNDMVISETAHAHFPESSAYTKGRKDNESSEKPSVPSAVPLFEENVNSRKKKINSLSETASNKMVTRKNARLMKDPDHDGSTISEVVEQQDPHHDGSAISEVEALDNMDTQQNALSQISDSMSKARSCLKSGMLKALAPECKPSEGADDSCDNFTYPVNSVIDLKDKPSHCLSSRSPRRWCMSEWCCTAIDYPWFGKSDFFAEYPNHVKLGHGSKLTRVEWGVIRSSFGKPRRFSKQFIQEEREKLSQYRESAGQHYVVSGVQEGLLSDLAQPSAVGQRPKARELHDGSVLTVDRNHCRLLQTDESELKRGFEFVMRTNMLREVRHLRWKIMCEVSSSKVNMRDLPGYLLANEWASQPQ